jgi:hypothetical protein
MNPRFFTVYILLAIISLALVCGCTSAPGTAPTAAPEPAGATGTPAAQYSAAERGIDEQLAEVRSESPVWREAYRMFSNVKSTEYVHPPYTVNDADGIYKFDCLGFVDHVLMNADPAGYKAIGKDVNPSIGSYAAYFNKLSTTSPDALGWTKVPQPINLQPGDVCLWLRPTTLDTGHMWIIAGEPKVNPKRTDEVLVRIFDSSVAHSDDSRTGSAYRTGLGSGILGMMVDNEGNSIGLYWDGGASTSAGEKDTTIVCGRLNG